MSPARRSPDPFQPTRCCCYFRILLKPAYFSRDHSRLGRLSPTEESSYHHHHHNFWLPPRRTRSATRSQQSSERSTLSDAYCFSYEACSHQEPSSATRSEDILAVTSNPLVGGERSASTLQVSTLSSTRTVRPNGDRRRAWIVVEPRSGRRSRHVLNNNLQQDVNLLRARTN